MKIIKNFTLSTTILNSSVYGMNEYKNKNKNENGKKNILKKISSNFILKKICYNLKENNKLILFKYNKNIQNRLSLSIKNYKEYLDIVIEIILKEGIYSDFININENYKNYYHIYFNDNNKEIKDKYSIGYTDNFEKIKIIIDYQVTSLKNLFYACMPIKNIKFIKFNRKNIINMHSMFTLCQNVENIDFLNFNTENVIDMSCMFSACGSLKNLDLTKFNTKNVKYIENIFIACYNLKEIKYNEYDINNIFLNREIKEVLERNNKQKCVKKTVSVQFDY